MPGYAAADGEEPVILPKFEVQWNDNPDDEKAHRRWAAETPKRFLAAPIAVGTIDQALLGILKVRHAHMRYALLARSLLVVDEVHASDVYMTALLERLLKAHLGNGGHALLLSATLGSSARTRYLALGRSVASATLPSFDEAGNTAYPALSDGNGLRPMARTGYAKHVQWSLHDCMDHPAVIAAMAIEAAATGAKVLVVRNTVPTAIAVLREIESQPGGKDKLSPSTVWPPCTTAASAARTAPSSMPPSRPRWAYSAGAVPASSSVPRLWSRASTSMPIC